MCVDHDAQLPALPTGPQEPTGGPLTLRASDGNVFDAYEARAPDVTGPAVLVLPDVRGLFGFYQDLACHFAAHGHPSVAIDYFGRTAGTGDRPADFAFMDHIPQTTSAGLNADIAAAVDHLRSDDPSTEVVTVGFCFGGSISWGATTHGHGLSGAIGFYGKPDADRPAGDGPIWDRCDLIEGRILGLFGGDDPGIPAENIDRFEAALESSGVEHEVVTYPGAPHSFFDRTQSDHTEASKHAWSRIVSLLSEI